MDFSEYKDIYVIAAAPDGDLPGWALELTGEAHALAEKTGDKTVVVLMGYHVSEQAGSLVAAGADVVYVMDSEVMNHYDGVVYSNELSRFLKEKKPSAVMFAADAAGRDLAPRVAGHLVCGVTADVTELSVDEKTGLIVWSRPAMGGNIMADIVSPEYRPQMGTIRPGTFRAPELDTSRKGEIIPVDVKSTDADRGTVVKEVIPQVKEENPVEEADIVVAGGRGIRTEEEWKLVHELADLLGGSVGASRPIVEKGWEPKERQIGQTGKFVQPHIYIALGISGAMQHMCGVKPDILVAVNRDESAPIMSEADYAVTADLSEFLPQLISEIRRAKQA
jgi:electron transfer flavoprotein alpha subunit